MMIDRILLSITLYLLLPIFYFPTFCSYFSERQSSRTDCRVDGQLGECILARDCTLVSNILQQSREQAIDYLRRNHCGFDRSNPMVCCISSINTRPGGSMTNPGTTQSSNSETTTPQPIGNTRIDLTNNPLLPNDCGRDLSQRIFGGNRTELDEFPWMTLLEYQKREQKINYKLTIYKFLSCYFICHISS